MSQFNIFGIAAMSGKWLAARQALVAENIANANTPGYRTKEVRAFASVLEQTSLGMARTGPRHLAAGEPSGMAFRALEPATGASSHSGNNVSLEAELLKAGEGRQQFALGANIAKTFQRLYLASLRS